MKSILTTLLFLLVYTVSYAREQNFSIPINTYCDNEHIVEITINVSNIGTEAVPAVLHLYRDNGQELTLAGYGGTGMKSDIIPGTTFTVPARSTLHYHYGFYPPSGLSCDDRVSWGKISVLSDSSRLLASGSVFNYHSTGLFRGAETIIINKGDFF